MNEPTVSDERLTSEDRLRLHVGDPETFAFAYEDAAGLQTEIDALRSELLELREAGAKVYADLNARIDAAPANAVPVFHGLAELHDALNKGAPNA